MIHFIRGRHGYGKSDTLFSLISDKVRAGNKTVLIIPEQASVITEREIGSFVNFPMLDFEILSFSRLADKIALFDGEPDHFALSKGKRALILYKILGNIYPGFNFFLHDNFDYIDKNFVSSIMNACDIIEKSYIPESFDISGSDDSSLSKFRDILLIKKAYDLSIRDEYNSYPDKLSHLNDMLLKSNWFEGKTVFFDSFDTFTSQQTEIIKKISKKAADIFFALPYYDNDESDAFSGINAFYDKFKSSFDTYVDEIIKSEPTRFKNEDIRFLEKNLWNFDYKYGNNNPFNASPENIRSVSCITKDDECRYVASYIRKRVREDGKRFSDFAVVSSNIIEYADIFDSIFNEYDIPYYLSRRYEISSSFIIRAVYALLYIIQFNYRKEDVIGFIKTNSLNIDKKDAELFENYLNVWNIRGKSFLSDDDWNMDPRGFCADERTENEKVVLETVNSIKQAILDITLPISNALKKGNIKEVCNKIFDFYSAIDKDKILSSENGLLVYNTLSSCLDDIVSVYKDDKTDIQSFINILDIVLSSTNIGISPRYCDRVTLSSAYGMRAEKITDIIIVGANESSFPPIVSDNHILNESDYTNLKKYGIELFDSEKFSDERGLYLVYKTLFFASERIILTYLESTDIKDDKRPGLVIKRINTVFNKDLSVKYSNILDLDLIESEKSAVRYAVLNSDSNLSFAVDDETESLIKSKNIKNITDYSISKETADKIFNKRFSITQSRVDKYAQCPFSYHCSYILKLKNNISSGIKYSEIGNFIHKIFEAFLSDLDFSDKTSLKMSKKEISERVNSISKIYLDAVFGGYEPPKRLIAVFSRLKRNLVDILDLVLRDFLTSHFRPVLFEYDLSEGSEKSKNIYELDFGDDIGKGRVYGRIDRVDILNKDENTYVRIVDYKSGYKKFNIDEDIKIGINIQMPLYMDYILNTKTRINDYSENNNVKCGAFLYLSTKQARTSREYGSDSREFTSYTSSKNMYTGVVNSLLEKEVDEGYVVKNEDELNDIISSVKGTVKNMCKELSEGNACAVPFSEKYVKYKDRTPCEYCEYISVCKKQRK